MTIEYGRPGDPNYGRNVALLSLGLGWCSGCQQELPLVEFSVQLSQHSGHSPLCRPCHARYSRDHDFRDREAALMALAIHEDNRRRTDGLRRCAECLQERPSVDFYRKGGESGARGHICVFCRGVDEGRAARHRENVALLAKGQRRCKSCEAVLPLERFYHRTAGKGWQAECKQCMKARESERERRLADA